MLTNAKLLGITRVRNLSTIKSEYSFCYVLWKDHLNTKDFIGIPEFLCPLKKHNPLIRLLCIFWLLPLGLPVTFYTSILCHEPFTWLRKQLLPLLTMSQFFSLPLSHNHFFKIENKSFEFVDYVALCFTTSGEVKSLGCIFPPTLTVLFSQYDLEKCFIFSFGFTPNSNRPIYHIYRLGEEPVRYLC